MGRGSSPMSKGSSNSTVAANANPAFDPNDWKTWQVGTKVKIGDQDIGFMDGIGKKGAMRLEDATITKVYDDHIIATTEDGVSHWIDDYTVEIVKSASNGNRTSKKRQS